MRLRFSFNFLLLAGRFLSADPAGFAGSTWDLYSFCGNDPINKFDPDGRLGKRLANGIGNALNYGSDFVSGVGNGAGYWASSTYASWGNMLDSALYSAVSPFNELTAVRDFSGGYE